MSELTFYFLQFQHYKKHILITGHVVSKGQQVFGRKLFFVKCCKCSTPFWSSL